MKKTNKAHQVRNFGMLIPEKLTDIPAHSRLFYHGEEAIPNDGKGGWGISSHEIPASAFDVPKRDKDETGL